MYGVLSSDDIPQLLQKFWDEHVEEILIPLRLGSCVSAFDIDVIVLLTVASLEDSNQRAFEARHIAANRDSMINVLAKYFQLSKQDSKIKVALGHALESSPARHIWPRHSQALVEKRRAACLTNIIEATALFNVADVTVSGRVFTPQALVLTSASMERSHGEPENPYRWFDRDKALTVFRGMSSPLKWATGLTTLREWLGWSQSLAGTPVEQHFGGAECACVWLMTGTQDFALPNRVATRDLKALSESLKLKGPQPMSLNGWFLITRSNGQALAIVSPDKGILYDSRSLVSLSIPRCYDEVMQIACRINVARPDLHAGLPLFIASFATSKAADPQATATTSTLGGFRRRAPTAAATLEDILGVSGTRYTQKDLENRSQPRQKRQREPDPDTR